MSLKKTLANDLKTAMKEKDRVRKDTIQMVRAAILQVEKDQRIVLDDAGVIDVIAREMKKRKDSFTDIKKSGRQDLIDKINREIETLAQYMPKQLSDEELEKIVREIIIEVDAKSIRDIGKVMKAAMQKVEGKADGSRINAFAKKALDT